MDRLGPLAVAVEALGQLIDLVARAAEDESRRRVLDVQDAAEGGQLVRAGTMNAVCRIFGIEPAVTISRGNLEVSESSDASSRWPRYAAASSRRRGLSAAPWVAPRGSRPAHPRTPCRAFVGLVQDDRPHSVQPQSLPPQMVERATGRGDDDVDSSLERAKLRVEGLPAVHRQHPDSDLASVAVRGLGHLHRELARGDETKAPILVRSATAVAAMPWMSGSAKAAVLPVPVAACARTSRPERSAGIAARCTGVGSS